MIARRAGLIARPVLRVIAIAGVLSLVLTTAGSAQRFRSSAELVTVDVLVTDNRVPVAGLELADFELLDNGVRQPLEQLYVEQLPVNVIMVLDTSGSVEGERLRSLQAGAMVLIDRLRKGDRAAVLSFSHRLDLSTALTADAAVLRRSVNVLTARGSTALRDAAFAALAMRAAESTRTLVLVFSDGLDTSSILSEERVLAVARRSDATVYAVGIRESVDRTRAGMARDNVAAIDDRFLDRLSRETAGRLLYAERSLDIERTFSRVLQEFNSRYVLGYAPRGVAGKGWHHVEVRLKKKRGTILARRGYFAE
jgi:VWFA-related protein